MRRSAYMSYLSTNRKIRQHQETTNVDVEFHHNTIHQKKEKIKKTRLNDKRSNKTLAIKLKEIRVSWRGVLLLILVKDVKTKRESFVFLYFYISIFFNKGILYI
jgi:hypothetical protein